MDVQQFKATVGRFPTGVTVVTVGPPATMHGTTVSAFMSVSLRPLLVAVCLRRPSRMLARMSHGARFAVNVLDADRADLARGFADPARPAGPASFRDVSHRFGTASGAPLLDDAVAWLECGVDTLVPAGDHALVLARVLTTGTGPGAPLIHVDGALQKLRAA